MEEQGNSTQFRCLIAAVLSMIVIFGWSYFYAPTKPAANTNAAANTAAAQPTPQATPTPQTAAPVPTTAVATSDTTPNRTITIKAPLYEVTLDSKGAVASSWILLKNKSPKEERPLYADGSTRANEKPLQLISPEALAKNQREVPFRLSTDDQNLNYLF